MCPAAGRSTPRLVTWRRIFGGTPARNPSPARGGPAIDASRGPTNCSDTWRRTRERSGSCAPSARRSSCGATTWPSTSRRTRRRAPSWRARMARRSWWLSWSRRQQRRAPLREEERARRVGSRGRRSLRRRIRKVQLRRRRRDSQLVLWRLQGNRIIPHRRPSTTLPPPHTWIRIICPALQNWHPREVRMNCPHPRVTTGWGCLITDRMWVHTDPPVPSLTSHSLLLCPRDLLDWGLRISRRRREFHRRSRNFPPSRRRIIRVLWWVEQGILISIIIRRIIIRIINTMEQGKCRPVNHCQCLRRMVHLRWNRSKRSWVQLRKKKTKLPLDTPQ